MPVAVAEAKQQLRRMIDLMEPEDVLRMLDYAAYLRYLEEREDAEDIAYVAEQWTLCPFELNDQHDEG